MAKKKRVVKKKNAKGLRTKRRSQSSQTFHRKKPLRRKKRRVLSVTRRVLRRHSTKKRKARRRKMRAVIKRNRRRVFRRGRAVRTHRPRSFHSRQSPPLLEALTGSSVRARLLRLLLREPQIAFSVRDAAERLGVGPALIRKEGVLLEQTGLLQTGGVGHRLRVALPFPFAGELRTLAVQSFPIDRAELLQMLRRAGKLRLVTVSGVFLNHDSSRVDLFVVANRLSERKLEAAVRRIEQNIGAEVRWAGMDTKEFFYRYRMFDRFVRDILTEPHEKVLENIKLS